MIASRTVVARGRRGRHLSAAGATHPRPDAGDAGRAFGGRRLTEQWRLPVFMLVHVALGIVVFTLRPAGTVHAWVSIGFGLWLVATTPRASAVARYAAYVTGAEVLWRMGGANVPWETGKYLTVVALAAGFVRFTRRQPIGAPLAYFVLLMPATVLLLQQSTDFITFRELASFNLSGPLTLAVAACFFRQVSLSKTDLEEMLVVVIGPVLSVATLTVLSTYVSSGLVFQDASNFSTSGGFGPNQVSSVLSMGAVLCFILLATSTDLSWRLQALIAATMVLCMVQSIMTFSRGGLYMALAGVAGALVCLARDRMGRRTVVVNLGAIMLLFAAIVPRLDQMTDGALATRFSDPTMSNRERLLQGDLRLFAEYPLFGVGLGLATEARGGELGIRAAAHTEWTRMLGEHGIFGLAALLVLLSLVAGNVVKAPGPREKAIVACFSLWCMSFFTVNAMRIAAPSFLIGVTCATLAPPHAWRPGAWRRRILRTHP